MASEEQKLLATTIKKIHSELRNLSAKVGADEAWKLHLADEATLKEYSTSMRELAENHWCNNATEDDRLSWVVSFCDKYFLGGEHEKWRLKELRTVEALREQGLDIKPVDEEAMTVEGKLVTLDVGSSGNFFSKFEQFDLLPIDISPANDSVAYCDFLSVPIADRLQRDARGVQALPANHFHVVIFCLLLEYLPTSDQRLKCCEKAHQVLKHQGLLIIVTPDSNHETKNSKQIKNWRWTLAKLGFRRVKLDKLKNLTCMAFRKSLVQVTNCWADTHREPYMKFTIDIPQDKLPHSAAIQDL